MDSSSTLAMVSNRPTLSLSTCPVAVTDPTRRAFFLLMSNGERLSFSARMSIWLSTAKADWGTPKPRKAPAGTLLV